MSLDPDAVAAILEPGGSMTASTLAETLVEEHDVSERTAQQAVVDAVAAGVIENHPEFDDTYRLPQGETV